MQEVCREHLDQLPNAMGSLPVDPLPWEGLLSITICDLFLIGEVANHIADSNSTGVRGDPSSLALPT